MAQGARATVQAAIQNACAPFLHQPNSPRIRAQLQAAVCHSLYKLRLEGTIPPETGLATTIAPAERGMVVVNLPHDLVIWLRGYDAEQKATDAMSGFEALSAQDRRTLQHMADWPYGVPQDVFTQAMRGGEIPTGAAAALRMVATAFRANRPDIAKQLSENPVKELPREIDCIGNLLEIYATAFRAGEPLVSNIFYDALVDRYWSLLGPPGPL